MIKPTLLAIDTTSAHCTVALCSGELLVFRTVESGRQYAQFVLPQLAELLVESNKSLQQIDAIAVLAGPGSFTGIRIGIGIAQGLGLANGTPVLPLSSLALKAFTALRETGQLRALVCENARDREVYFAAYNQNVESGVALIGMEQACAPENIHIAPEFGSLAHNWVAVGSGWESPVDIWQRLGLQSSREPVDPDMNCSDFCELASLRFLQGEAVPAAQALPNYVKESLNYKR